MTGDKAGRVVGRRVYVVCTEVPPDVVGGLGRYAQRLMAALRDGGTTVEVFGTAARWAAAGTERTAAVTLHRIRTAGAAPDRSQTGRGRVTRVLEPVARMLEPVARLAGLVMFNVVVAARILWAGRRSRDVVAVHDWMGCLAGILCRVLGRRPVVLHVHSREWAHSRSLIVRAMRRIEAVQVRLAQLIVVPSLGMREELVALGWPAGRLRVIPHGHEDHDLIRLAALDRTERIRLRAAIRARYLPDGDGALVIFAGRLSPHKGVRTLLRAVPKLVAQRCDVRVVIVGGQQPRSDDNAEVARLVERLGVEDHVHADFRFVGSAEVFEHFLAADVCAFPSTYEPFGLVAVEAMALGAPVVVGPGYSPEVVGPAAVRCDSDSPDELAAALLSCLDGSPTAAQRGERGAAYVRQRYTWRRTAEATLAAYAEVAR